MKEAYIVKAYMGLPLLYLPKLGGMFGEGFLKGSQTRGKFVPWQS